MLRELPLCMAIGHGCSTFYKWSYVLRYAMPWDLQYRPIKGACISSLMTSYHVDCWEWPDNDSQRSAVDCSWLRDVHIVTDSSNRPTCSSAAGSWRHWKRFMLVRGWTIAPQNNLPPSVRDLMHGRLLRDTGAFINGATFGCKEWTTERFLAHGKGYSSFTPNTLLSGSANRCQHRDSVSRAPWPTAAVAQPYVATEDQLTCSMFPWLKPQTLSIIGI